MVDHTIDIFSIGACIAYEYLRVRYYFQENEIFMRQASAKLQQLIPIHRMNYERI